MKPLFTITMYSIFDSHVCNTSIFTLKPCRSGLGNLTCALNSYSMHHPNQLHIASRQEMKKPCSIDPRHPVIPPEVWCFFFKKAGGKQIFAQMMWTWESLLTVIWTTPPPAETQLDWTRSLGNNSVIGGNQSSYLNGSFKQKNVGHAACISLSLSIYIKIKYIYINIYQLNIYINIYQLNIYINIYIYT